MEETELGKLLKPGTRIPARDGAAGRGRGRAVYCPTMIVTERSTSYRVQLSVVSAVTEELNKYKKKGFIINILQMMRHLIHK